MLDSVDRPCKIRMPSSSGPATAVPTSSETAIPAQSFLSLLLQAPLVAYAKERISTHLEALKLPVKLSNAAFDCSREATLSERLRFEHYLRNDFFKMIGIVITETVIKTPVQEEFAFRALPSACSKKLEVNWTLGLIVALGFALAHNFQKKSDLSNPAKNSIAVDSDTTFSLKHFHLGAFLGGAYYWWLARTTGISSAIFAHAANNGIATLSDFRELCRVRKILQSGGSLDWTSKELNQAAIAILADLKP